MVNNGSDLFTSQRRSQTVSEPALLTSRDGHIMTVTFNRPASKNALNLETLARLADDCGDPSFQRAVAEALHLSVTPHPSFFKLLLFFF